MNTVWNFNAQFPDTKTGRGIRHLMPTNVLFRSYGWVEWSSQQSRTTWTEIMFWQCSNGCCIITDEKVVVARWATKCSTASWTDIPCQRDHAHYVTSAPTHDNVHDACATPWRSIPLPFGIENAPQYDGLGEVADAHPVPVWQVGHHYWSHFRKVTLYTGSTAKAVDRCTSDATPSDDKTKLCLVASLASNQHFRANVNPAWTRVRRANRYCGQKT